MVFWHIGGSVWLFRWVFRDPKVDVRYLALGAILSDVVDKPIGTIIAPDVFGASRLWGHSLLFAVAVMTVVMVTTRRGPRRKRWMALSVGVFFHLLLDAAWRQQETFLWPFLGTEFTPGVDNYWAGLLGRLFDSPWALAGEVAGLGYLWFVWRQAELGDPQRRSVFRKTGVLPLVE